MAHHMMVETNKKIQYIHSRWILQHKCNRWLIGQISGSHSNVVNKVSPWKVTSCCLASGFPSTHCYSLQDLNPEMTHDLYKTDIRIIIWDLLMCCNDRLNKLVGW